MVMRSYNEAWALPATLQSALNQDFPGHIQLIVIDSASTDDSHAIIRRFHPAVFEILEPGTYVPGKVLNRGLQLAAHDWVVFLNSDATPANRQWLPALLRTALAQPNPGTAFSRQIPRPDCQAVFAHDYDRCFGPNRESSRWDHFFSMVSCVVHRPTWQAFPFREDLQFAEDDEWSRRLRAHGRDVSFAPESIAIHSHNYSPPQAYKRARGDAIAVAAAGNAPASPQSWLRAVFFPTLRDACRDFSWCRRTHSLNEWPHACQIRLQQRRGRFHGYQLGRAAATTNNNNSPRRPS